jgi:hypothetical protein
MRGVRFHPVAGCQISAGVSLHSEGGNRRRVSSSVFASCWQNDVDNADDQQDGGLLSVRVENAAWLALMRAMGCSCDGLRTCSLLRVVVAQLENVAARKTVSGVQKSLQAARAYSKAGFSEG